MNRTVRAAIGLAASLIVASGCGTGGSSTPTKITSSADAGPNARLKFKEEYKQMLGKDGKMLWKPSESSRRPKGIPK